MTNVRGGYLCKANFWAKKQGKKTSFKSLFRIKIYSVRLDRLRKNNITEEACLKQ